MLAQGYHAKWKLRSQGAHNSPVPVFSVANGFMLAPGAHSGSIEFTGQRFAWWGIVLSVLSLIAIVVLMSLRRSEPPAARQLEHVSAAVSRNGYKRIDAAPRRLIQAAVASGVLVAVSPLAAVIFLIVATVILRPTWWMVWAWGLILLAIAPLCVALGIDVALDDLAFLFLISMTIGLVLLVREARSTPPAPRRCRATTRKGEPCRRAPVNGSEFCATHQYPHAPAAREETPVLVGSADA
jgi:hypothetical protein